MLVTPRLILREARVEDVSALASYQRDPRYLEHYTAPADAREIVRLACTWATESPRTNYQLIVCRDEEGPVIGCAGLRQRDHAVGEAEVGIELDPAHWGIGYASEALAELIRFGRRDLHLTRLWALTSASNVNAHRLLARLGFSPEPASSSTHFGLALRSLS